MNCFEAQDQLIEALKEGPSTALEAHLETCTDCRKELDSLRKTWTTLGEPSHEKPLHNLLEVFHATHPLIASRSGTREKRPPRSFLRHPVLLTSAAALLLAFGYWVGHQESQPKPVYNLALMRNPSPYNRILGIELINAQSTDPALASALFDLIEHDPNIPVRLTAVEALYLFRDAPRISDRAAQALESADTPEVQIALMDLMVGLREHRAIEALRHLLKDQRLRPDVRHRAEEQLKQLRS